MATSSALIQVGARSSEGQVAPGMHREVISGVGATRTLKNNESGALVLLDSASGVTYTLPPAPELGCQFEFNTSVTVTTNSHKVVTSGGKFILGAVFGYTTDATEIDGFTADGTTIVSVTSNGNTTGGVAGDNYRLTYNGSVWIITGNIFCGTSTPATPFATT